MGGENGGEELEIMHWWTAGGEEDAMQALLEGFEEEHPEYDVHDNPSPGGAGSALEAEIRNRVIDGNPPSTFQIWPGEALSPYTDEGLFEPIDDIWTDEMRDAYLDGPAEAAQQDGEFVAVPININRLNSLYYNIEVVEESGVDLEGIDTPTALVEALNAIEAETGAAGLAHQTQEPWSTLQLWAQVLLGEFGAEAYQQFIDGEVESVAEEVRESLQVVVEYSAYFNEDASSLSWDQANNHVINGDAGLVHEGTWGAGQYENTDSFEFGEDWDYITFPGTEELYTLNMDSFPYPVENPSPEATEAFLTYAGSIDAQERVNPPVAAIPPRTDVPRDEFSPFLREMMDLFEASEMQLPSIAHGLAVPPDVQSEIENTFATFNGSWDVEETYQELVSAFDE